MTFRYPENIERAIKRAEKERLSIMDKEERKDYFEGHYREIAEKYWNDDASGDLSSIGEMVLNNPKLFTAFLEVWGEDPNNEKMVKEWFDNIKTDGLDERNR